MPDVERTEAEIWADRLRSLVSDAIEAGPGKGRQNRLKLALVLIWQELLPDHRQSFVQRLELWGEYSFITWRKRIDDRDDPALEECVRNWPYVSKYFEGGEKFERGFCSSITKTLKRQKPRLSDKQVLMMKRLHSAWRRDRDVDQDADLVANA